MLKLLYRIEVENNDSRIESGYLLRNRLGTNDCKKIIADLLMLIVWSWCSTPFELHDDNYVLKAMEFCERPQGDDMAHNFSADGGEGSSMSSMYQTQIPLPTMSNTPVRNPTSPPLPGILKARIKHEH